MLQKISKAVRWLFLSKFFPRHQVKQTYRVFYLLTFMLAFFMNREIRFIV